MSTKQNKAKAIFEEFLQNKNKNNLLEQLISSLALIYYQIKKDPASTNKRKKHFIKLFEKYFELFFNKHGLVYTKELSFSQNLKKFSKYEEDLYYKNHEYFFIVNLLTIIPNE